MGSSFVMSNKDINVLVKLVDEFELCSLCDSLKTKEAKERLGQLLCNMNRKAVNRRYGLKKKPIKFTYLPESLEELTGATGDEKFIVAYKILEEYLYFCHESDIPKWRLYREMKGIKVATADLIVSHLPAYEKAPDHLDPYVDD